MRRSRPAPPSRRTTRLVLVGAALLALATSTALVWQSAYATFTDAAPAVAATVGTGTLALADDDAGSTLFAVGRLKPGGSGVRCITVSATGTSPSEIRFYGTGRSVTRGLDAALRLTVRSGTGGTTSSCTGFQSTATVYDGTLAGFTAADFASGLGTWTTTGAPATRTYQIGYALATTAPTSAQGGTAGLSFVWEAQSR